VCVCVCVCVRARGAEEEMYAAFADCLVYI
jgi:hypothetical protein